jgi:hypothetical protein
MPWPCRFGKYCRVLKRIAVGLRLSASRHLLCQQATSKHSDMVVPVHADVSPGPDKAVTLLVHSVYQMLLIKVVAQFVKVLLCLQNKNSQNPCNLANPRAGSARVLHTLQPPAKCQLCIWRNV